MAVILAGWLAFMALSDNWHLFTELWEVPATLAFGSFVAGFSAEGSGAVAFPVFTKVLHVPPEAARQFSLLTQSFGMSMASLVIIMRKTPFYAFAIVPAVLGGAIGQALSVAMNWFVPGLHLKWLFTVHIAALGFALLLKHFSGIERREAIDEKKGRPLLFWSGLAGGFLTINIGCGADMLAFIILVLLLSATEKKATPTTVIIMAINSVIGVVVTSLAGEWSAWAVSAWQTAIPVVIFGAPLGAFLASKANNPVIFYALLSFIAAEVLSTLWLVPMPGWVIPVFLVATGLMCGVVAWKYRRQMALS